MQLRDGLDVAVWPHQDGLSQVFGGQTRGDLLAQAKAHDEQVRQAARQARPAGEDDPYRKPRQEEDEVSPSGGTGA